MNGDALDQKVTRIFAGKVVRKDLLHQIKGGENVPSYVLEYLLGKYCASDDEDEIRIGIDAVKETLRNNYFRHDESNKAQSMVEQKGKHRFIDRIEVRFLASETKYWAAMDNFNFTQIHIPDDYYRRYERLLEGGIWAIVDVEFRPIEEGTKGSPFHVADLKPIQLARFDLDEYVEGRRELSREEWIDLLLRSVGLETVEDGTAAEAAPADSVHTLRGEELQLHRAGPAGDRKVVCVQRDVALLHSHLRR